MQHSAWNAFPDLERNRKASMHSVQTVLPCGIREHHSVSGTMPPIGPVGHDVEIHVLGVAQQVIDHGTLEENL